MTHVLRAGRQPLTWLVMAALGLLAMLALESIGGTHAPSLVPLTTVANNGSTAADNNGGQPSRHCGNGHGQDATHNPHCRGASGGQ